MFGANKDKINTADKSVNRLKLIIICLVVVFAFILFRAYKIQVVDSDFLNHESDKRSLRSQAIESSRGLIKDREGRILATSISMQSISISPYFIAKGAMESHNRKLAKKGIKVEKIADKDLTLDILRKYLQQDLTEKKEAYTKFAQAIDMTYSQLSEKLLANAKVGGMVISRHQPNSVIRYIKDLKIKHLSFENDPRRFYPYSEKVSNVIGFATNGVGVEGIEYGFNDVLTGKNGLRQYRKAAVKNKNYLSDVEVENVSYKKEIEAHDINLSIDMDLQGFVFDSLEQAVNENKATSGSAVVIDIKTGEILALASYPSYNPHNFDKDDMKDMKNRAIVDTYEPGSTVKPFVVLTGLENKVIGAQTIINTTSFKANGFPIKDVGYHKQLSITGILQKSSNVGVARIALKTPINKLLKTYQEAGFGMPVNLGLPGESSGKMPHLKRYSDIDIATLAFGYGILASPLQLAHAYATLGGYGVYRPLSINKVNPNVVGRQVFDKNTSETVLKMLEAVTQKGEGGQRAAVNGYRISAKTGTAKKVENGKYVNKYVALTAGVAPTSNPRYALAVIIDEPSAGKYYGGAVAAPVFSKIMEKALVQNNVIPDAIETLSANRKIINLNQQASN